MKARQRHSRERERLASEIAAHQHVAFMLPACDEGFFHFVQAEVKKTEMTKRSRAVAARGGDHRRRNSRRKSR